MLDANRSSCNIKGKSEYVDEQRDKLTWYSVIIECHSMKARIDMLVFIPPQKEIVVRDAFGTSGQVTSYFVEHAGYWEWAKSWETVKDVVCLRWRRTL